MLTDTGHSRTFEGDDADWEQQWAASAGTRFRVRAVCATLGMASSVLLISLTTDPALSHAAIDWQTDPAVPLVEAPLDQPQVFEVAHSPSETDHLWAIDPTEVGRIEAQASLTLLIAKRARIAREIRQVSSDAMPDAGTSTIDPNDRDRTRDRLTSLARHLAAVVDQAQAVKVQIRRSSHAPNWN